MEEAMMPGWFMAPLTCLLSFGAGYACARAAALREITTLRLEYASELDGFTAKYRAFERELERMAKGKTH